MDLLLEETFASQRLTYNFLSSALALERVRGAPMELEKLLSRQVLITSQACCKLLKI